MAVVYASVFCIFLVAAPVRSEPPEELIQDVQVRGNHRMPADSIKYRIQTKAGDRLNAKTVSRDVKTLYALGYFEDIRVEEQATTRGPIVIFNVRERPLVRAIKYEGLQSVANSEIAGILKDRKADLPLNSPYDSARIRRAESVLKQILTERGRQNPQVEARTEYVESGANVTFVVKEGPKLKIEKIEIEGNKAFSDSELKNVMKLSKEVAPITLFTRNDTYDHLKLSDDISRIRMHYADSGYVRANIQESSLEIKPKTVYRTFPFFITEFPLGIPIPFWKKQEQRIHLKLKVEENTQYRIGQVTIIGNKAFSIDTIRFTLGLTPGAVYNEERLRSGLSNLRKLYGGRGYINFTAVPTYDLQDRTRTVNLTVNIDEDRKFYVNRLGFSGNMTTRDKVIRREFLLAEGDVFSSDLLDRSLLRVNQLGYFEMIRPEDAEMKLDPDNASVDINLKLKERDGNKIGFNGGVSGAAGGFLGVTYSTNNFLGLGETMSVNLERGTRYSQYQLQFTEPYTLGRPLTTGFSLFSTNFQYDQSGLFLSQRRSGFNLSSSHPLSAFQRLGLSYQLDNSHISSVDAATQGFFSTLATGPQNVSSYLSKRVISTYTLNTVNNPNWPTKGHSLTASMETAGGLLGGNVSFYRPSFEYRAFKPVNRGRNTLALRLSGSFVRGFSNKSVPFYERFFMGGDYDLRGMDFRSVSPIAFITSTTDGVQHDDILRVGGDTQALLNFEYRIPIAGPITLAPFVDVGNSWVLDTKSLRRQVSDALGNMQAQNVRFLPGSNSGIRVSTGVELQITMPLINLPFRLIFAVNPTRINQTYVGPNFGNPISIREPFQGFKFTIGKTF
jgi:outer membrane protein insertion porin family